MRIRNFLVVHSSRTIRAMIAKCILAEFGDVQIVESSAGREALAQLRSRPFDLVICNSELEDMHIADLSKEMMENPSQNRPAEIIALLGAEDDMDRLVGAGLEHMVTLPFDPENFIAKINRVCDPRKWRQSERFHIPNSKVILNVWGMEAEAVMINISRGGVLMEISGDRSELLLQNNPKLTLKIKGPHGYHDIPKLPAKLTRLSAIGWNEEYKPIVMRVAFVFLELDQTSEAELGQVLQMAKEDSLYADEE